MAKSGRQYMIVIKHICIKFDDFIEMVECYYIEDCMNDYKKLNVSKL